MCAMKKSRVLSILFVVALLAVAVIAGAQQQPKIAKIGWLESCATVRGSRLGELFVRKLRELGYVEGKNISFEYQSADDKLDRLPALAGELVRLNVEAKWTNAQIAALLIMPASASITVPLATHPA